MSRTKLLDGKLTAEEKIVAEYIDANASDILVEKINNSDKGMSDCWSFIVKQAKDKAGKHDAVGVAAMEVFGWAIHYFEEDSIKKGDTPKIEAKVETVKEDNVAAVAKEPIKIVKVEKKPKEPKSDMLPGQMTIFELMGMNNGT